MCKVVVLVAASALCAAAEGAFQRAETYEEVMAKAPANCYDTYDRLLYKPDQRRVSDIAKSLPQSPRFERYMNFSIESDAQRIARAEAALARPIPVLTDEMYREVYRNGSRSSGERPMRDRVRMMLELCSGEAAEGKGRFLARIAELLETFSLQKSWVWPNHHSEEEYLGDVYRIDLGVAEVARAVACAVSQFGGKLPPAVVETSKARLRERVFDVYLRALEIGGNGGWYSGAHWATIHNNWNSGCHYGVVSAALAVVEDRETRARFCAAWEVFNGVFMKGYSDDGYCTEGVGYWNFGFGENILLGLVLRDATGGLVDTLSSDKARRVASYSASAEMLPGISPAFADCGMHARFDERILAARDEAFPGMFRDRELGLRSYFPTGQVLVARGPGFAAAMKGGFNFEQHNHNDIGSYNIATVFGIAAGDCGSVQYRRDTFGPNRYDNKMLSSYGHPVPVVDGRLQSFGRKYAARVVRADFSGVCDVWKLDMKGGYDVDGLKSLVRTFTFNRSAMSFTVRDDVEFERDGEFSVPIIVPGDLKPGADASEWHVELDGRRQCTVRVSVEGGEWGTSTERISNPGRVEPLRMAVSLSGRVRRASVAFEFRMGDCDSCRWVDPMIGTSGPGHTFPAACVPFGLVQAGPDTGNGAWEYCSGYRYDDATICGFTQTHLNGTGCPDLGDLRLLPFRGEKPLPSAFSHEDETAQPGYYAVALKDAEVSVEVTATEHSAIYRMSGKGVVRLLVDCAYGITDKDAIAEVESSDVRLVGRNGLVGQCHRNRWVERDYAFAVEFDRPSSGVTELPRAPRQSAPSYVFEFDLRDGTDPLLVKLAFSAEGGPEAAARNLAAEIRGWDFDATRNAAHSKWRSLLGVAEVDGSDDQRRSFYTSLYHLFVQPNNIADVGEKPFYSTLSTWDTFRAAHPLYTIIAPDKAGEFVESMLEQGRRTGYLPIWTLWGRDNQCMIGTHSVPVIVDWFLKTSGSSDSSYWQAAYEQVKDTLTQRHEGRLKERWDLYDRHGYYPYDVIKGESVSRTMECAYDDWCAAQMAERLGHAEDALFFRRRSARWRNIIDTSLGLARGRNSRGAWREPFDPYALGHGAETANDFTEGNAFQYTWHVMQDPQGLIEALGGPKQFATRLDGIFAQPEKIDGPGCVVDVTGLIGQYVHGNEPSHHVIYFYTLVGQRDKAAERIREVFDKFYLPKPDGLCGNDDCGQMSAWYLFSAMGFYPFNPCGGEYVVGAPQVPKAVLSLPGGRSFTVTARNLSRENKYVKSATLNGRSLTNWKIMHSDIMAGGELVFEMCAHPAAAGGK